MADLSVQSVGTLARTHLPQVYVCYYQPHFIIWAPRQTALRARPIKYSGIQLPQRVEDLGISVLVDLDLNDLS